MTEARRTRGLNAWARPAADPKRDLEALETAADEQLSAARAALIGHWFTRLASAATLNQARLEVLAGQDPRARTTVQELTEILRGQLSEHDRVLNPTGSSLKALNAALSALPKRAQGRVARLVELLSEAERQADAAAAAELLEEWKPERGPRPAAPLPLLHDYLPRPLPLWRAAALRRWEAVPSSHELRTAIVWRLQSATLLDSAEDADWQKPPTTAQIRRMDHAELAMELRSACFGVREGWLDGREITSLGPWVLTQDGLLGQMGYEISNMCAAWERYAPQPARPGHPLIVPQEHPEWEKRTKQAIARLGERWRPGQLDPDEPGCPWTPEQAFLLRNRGGHP